MKTVSREAFRRLLSPGRIGPMETPNRIVMSPMGTNLAEPDGRVGKRLLDYYEARARGGAGLLVVGVAAVAYPRGQAIPGQVAVSDDTFLPGLTELAHRIHAHGVRAALQLQHAGKVATRDIAAGRPLWVPSPPDKSADMGAGLMQDLTSDEIGRLVANLAGENARMEFHEMTREDIAEAVHWFADAAARAQRAGFDGVELHAGHGYLIASFLSPASNRRTDEYGGPLENRARFLLETIRAVRGATGPDFALWCRIDACEYRIDGGITPTEACATAHLVEQAGADAVHVSAYANPYIGAAFTEAPLVHRPAGFIEFASAIKRRVSIPVIAVGRITPERAERALEAEEADFIAMARPLLADPDLPKKLAEGRRAEVRPCVYCYTCVGNIFVNDPVVCAVNPRTAREAELTPTPATKRRRVLVVGGGPAGLEAARVAAERGHEVMLCESERALGGTLRLAALVWEPHADLLDYLISGVTQVGVRVRLACRVDERVLGAFRPDTILVATGARHRAPAIEGTDQPWVLSSEEFHDLMGGRPPARKLAAWQRALVRLAAASGLLAKPRTLARLSRRWMPLGRRVVIVGGGLVGVELAEFLVSRGRTVTIVEQGPFLAPEMAIPRRWRALDGLRRAGVELLTETAVERIDADGTHLTCDRTIAADHVVLATGAHPDASVAERLAGRHPDVRAIGDCREVGMLAAAIEAGARAACAL